MSDKMKIAVSIFLRSFLILFGAFLFGLMTFFGIWEWTAESAAMAYVLNGVIIVAVIIEDKLKLHYFYKRKKSLFKSKARSNAFDYLILEKHTTGFAKSSLYLFYIFALVFSHILIMNPDFAVSESVRGYFNTIGYGLVILIAIDKFVGQLAKDNKLIRSYKESSME